VQPRNAMFNDAQIASIKARLRLDKNQEQHWVPVELALRRIVWRWASSSGPQLDPMSIQSLAIASTALIAELHEHQKRELRVLRDLWDWTNWLPTSDEGGLSRGRPLPRH
jgi:hypothetical protein